MLEVLSTRFQPFLRFLFLLFLTFRLNAQSTSQQDIPSVGEHLYQKLEETQQEFAKALATGDSLQVAEMSYRLGKRYIGLGDGVSAHKWFIRALRIWEPQGPSEGAGKTYLHMAGYQGRMRKDTLALQYAHRSINHFRAVGSQHGVMSASAVLGGVHFLRYELNSTSDPVVSKRSLDSALYYYALAKKNALALDIPYDIANMHFLYGATLFSLRSSRGISYIKKADSLYLDLHSTFQLLNTSMTLAEWYLKHKQMQQANFWLSRTQSIMDTSQSGDHEQKKKFYELNSNFYQQQNNWSQALVYSKKYYQATVEALKAEREGAVSRLHIEYETEKKANQLHEQEQRLELQKKVILITTALCLLALGTGFVLFFLLRKNSRISQQNTRLIQEQNHRVKNNFQRVSNLLNLQLNRVQDPVAQKVLRDSLLRIDSMALVHQRLYDNDRLAEVNLTTFLPDLVKGVLHSYACETVHPVYSIHKIWLHVDQAIPLGLILNELVTNSCKYAFPTQPTPRLYINCYEDRNVVSVEVRDNGPGIGSEVPKKSFGLQLIKLFSEQLKGTYNFDSHNGYKYTLSFALRSVAEIQLSTGTPRPLSNLTLHEPKI